MPPAHVGPAPAVRCLYEQVTAMSAVAAAVAVSVAAVAVAAVAAVAVQTRLRRASRG